MVEHRPVLLREVLGFLDVKPGRRYIDATVGGGGHASEILRRGGDVLGIDQDSESLDIARRRLEKVGGKGFVTLVRGNFANLKEVALEEGFGRVDGVLFDLGVASFQLDDASRGLSFSKEGPLDMRLDATLGVTAADLVNSLPGQELVRLFSGAGEGKAWSIVRAICRRRSVGHIKTTTELRELVEEVYKGAKSYRVHPATKVFMALRIAVNLELENLRKGLPQALELLEKGGRLVVISFHSGEDRVVKEFMRSGAGSGDLQVLTRRPVVPSTQEVAVNPRARSARLRVGEKV